MGRIQGWLAETDLRLFALVDDAQRERGIVGDLVEFGAYHGKLAIALGFLAGPDERVVVCDLFDDLPQGEENRRESSRYYADLTRAAFDANWRHFHGSRPVTVVQEDSTVWGGRGVEAARIVHLDGGHAHEVVVADLRTSRALARDGAIVVLDDYRRDGLPGVAAAAWGAVATEGLVPLCLSSAKLYATWGPPDPALAAALSDRVHATFGARVDTQVVGGRPVLVVAPVPGVASTLASRLVPARARSLLRSLRRS